MDSPSCREMECVLEYYALLFMAERASGASHWADPPPQAFLSDSSLVPANYVTIACVLLSLAIFVPLSARLKAAGY